MRWPWTRKQDPPMDADEIEADGQDGLITIEAGPVTLIGEPRLVQKVLGGRAGTGLSTKPGHAKAMSKDEDHIMTGVYVGVGLLLAVGAGYVAWRYLLNDEQKTHAKDLLADSATKAKRAVRDAKGRLTV